MCPEPLADTASLFPAFFAQIALVLHRSTRKPGGSPTPATVWAWRSNTTQAPARKPLGQRITDGCACASQGLAHNEQSGRRPGAACQATGLNW